MRGSHLGELEELVLLAVFGLGADAYAVSVQQRIESGARRAVSIGAVYSALERLERKGFLASRLGEPTPDRGGRRKRHYRINQAGREEIERVRGAREAMWRLARHHDV